MKTLTHKHAIDAGLTIPQHIIEDTEIPVVRSHRQGDTCFLPEKHDLTNLKQVKILPQQTYQVVKGEAVANTHQIMLMEGTATFHEGVVRNSTRDYGVLIVDKDSQVLYQHTGEHGPSCLREGPYRFFGQYDISTERRMTD